MVSVRDLSSAAVEVALNIPVLSAFDGWVAANGGSTETFTGDANQDGVADGVAWLLGAQAPSTKATGLLPVASPNNGALSMSFRYLSAAKRGSYVLRVQHGTTLAAGSWTEVAIPEAMFGQSHPR